MANDRGRYDYSPAAMIVGELDGLRIISSFSCDFVQKVPGESYRYYVQKFWVHILNHRLY